MEDKPSNNPSIPDTSTNQESNVRNIPNQEADRDDEKESVESSSKVNERNNKINIDVSDSFPAPPPVPHASENPIQLSNSSSDNNEEPNQSGVVKCEKPNCKDMLYIRKCSTPQCGCLHCYHCIHLVYKKNKLPSLLINDGSVDPTHMEEVPICTKSCYNTVQKILDKEDDIRIPWNKDGQNGKDDPNNSNAILINWLITEGNYHCYCSDVGHHKKVDVAKQVADKINAAGVGCKHTGKQVQSKIKHLKACFTSAYNYTNSKTGQGLREHNKGSFEEQCLRRCPHYFDLFDIMADHPGVQPVATSAEKNNDDDNNDHSPSSKEEGVDLDEQRRVVAMAFDQDSEDAEEKEENDSSSGSSTKATKKEIPKIQFKFCHIIATRRHLERQKNF